MKYAQIKNGVIVNVIVLDDPSLEPIFSKGFDSLEMIGHLSPVPGIGWIDDGETFHAPVRAPKNLETKSLQEQIDELKKKLEGK